MGFVLSCCRRRKDRKDDEEARPLLKDAEQSSDQARLLARLANMVGALKAGKLPSQEQINHAVRLLLASDALKPAIAAATLQGYELSEPAARVLLCLRQVLEMVAQVGLEKNDDDLLQELLYLGSQAVHKPERLAASVQIDREDGRAPNLLGNAPSQGEVAGDISSLLQSFISLCWLLTSSAVFRLLLSDSLAVLQNIAATAAIEVDSVAAQVASAAEHVEVGVRANAFSVQGAVDAAQDVKDDFTHLREEEKQRILDLRVETTDKLTHSFVVRVQQLVTTAQSDIRYRTAMITILSIGRKYASFLRQVADDPGQHDGPTSTLHPAFNAESALRSFLEKAKSLAERFASGHSLDAFLQRLDKVAFEVVNLPAGTEAPVRAFISDTATWLDEALHRPDYARSKQGSDALGELYNRGSDIFGGDSPSPLASDIRALSDELKMFASRLATDRSTGRLLDAIDRLRVAFLDFIPASTTTIATETRRRKEAATRDIILWLVPRILSLIKSIPLPRIEYSDPALQIVLDSFTLTPTSLSASLLPDHVHLANWNEIHVDNTPSTQGAARMHTTQRISLRLDGVRFAAENLGFFLRYAPPRLLGLGYTDRGLLSVLVGASGPGQGLRVDASLSIHPDEFSEGQPPGLFDVESVHADVPGLHFSLDRTSHWLINKLLVQPLAAPAVRLVAGSVLQAQMRAGLELLSVLLGQWRELAVEESTRDVEASLLTQYYRALLRLPSIVPEEDGDDQDGDLEEDEASAGIQTTETTLTRTGLVRTTVVEPADAESGQEAERTAIAIGLAPQVVHEAAGPADAAGAAPDIDASTRTGVAIERVVDDVEAEVANVRGEVGKAAGEARSMVEDVVRSREAVGTRASYERRRKGWRSEAFTL
ncbi:hypothetical protein PENSPDRAFT_603963 [Peniophora sp. CONT]|nr:hypothetical protein PENSPDRAFT_603963 [Peniophora sp. CONT]